MHVGFKKLRKAAIISAMTLNIPLFEVVFKIQRQMFRDLFILGNFSPNIKPTMLVLFPNK